MRKPARRDIAAELLGPLELDALSALWATGPATVRDALVHINSKRPTELAYTTVMTVLDRLHEKQLVERSKVGRAWRYMAVHPDEDALVAHLGRTQVDDLLERFGDVALAHFARTLDGLDPSTRARLKALGNDDV